MSLIRYVPTLTYTFGVLTASLSFAGPLHAATPAASPLKVQDCDFGEVYAFAPAGCAFTLTNAGDTPLTLDIVPVQPDHNSATPSHLTLEPHASEKIATHVNTRNIAGEIAWTFRIDGAGAEPQFARAGGFVMSVLDDPRPRISFGEVDVAAGTVTKSVTMNSSVVPTFRITRVLSAPGFLHAKIGEDGRTLATEVGTDAPWGPFDEMVKLAIDSPQQPEAWVQVTGSVKGEIGPEKNPHWFGTVPWAERRTLAVDLIDSQSRGFTIGKVVAHPDLIGRALDATFDSRDCEPAHRGCRTLVIEVGKDQPPGFFKYDLDVKLPDQGKHLNLSISGIFALPPAPAGVAAPTPGIEKIQMPKAPDADAPVPPLKVTPAPPGDGPLLKWRVAHQGNVHGYQVFRGDSADGPFTVVSPHMVDAIDNGTGPVEYQWRDTTAVKGHTYWYYIAVMYKTGTRQPLSGPQKTVAK